MRKSLYCVVILLLTVTIVSCNNAKKTNVANTKDSAQINDMHNAENSLDFYGEYKGIIPAADCPGIRITLTLNKDKSFTSKWVYLEREGSDVEEAGVFTSNGNTLTLTSKEGDESYYKVEEGRIIMLNGDKQPAEGAMKDKYVLMQEKVF